MDNYLDWINKHKLFVVLCVFGFVAVMLVGAKKLTITADYKIFFDKNNEYLSQFEKHQSIYDKSENILLALDFGSKDVFSRENLSIVREITKQLWQVPYSTRVDSVTNFQRSTAVGDEIFVGDLVSDPNDLTPAEIEALYQYAISEKLLFNRLIGESASVVAINITQSYPPSPINERKDALEYVRDLRAEYAEKYPSLSIHISGLTALNGAFTESAKGDLKKLTPLMMLAIIITVGLVLRTVKGVLSVFLLVILSSVIAFGCAGWMGMTLSPPALSALNIILIINVAIVVHVFTNYYQSLSETGAPQGALKATFQLNAKALLITGLTTIIGFLSMNFSEAPPFRTLGNIVSLGVVAAMILTFTLLPILLSSGKDEKRLGKAQLGTKLMTNLSSIVIDYRASILVATVSLVCVLGYMAQKNVVNDRYSEYFSEATEFRQATDFVSNHLPSLYTIEFNIKSKGANGVSDPEYLYHLDRFVTWLRKEPNVANVYTLADTIKRLNKNMHEDDESYYAIPENNELASQYLLMYELSLPFGLDLNSQISADRSSTRVTGTLTNLSTREMLVLEETTNQWVIDNLPEYMWTDATSPSVMFCHIALRNIKSGFLGGIVALLIICACLIMVLKSMKLGLISVIPNIVPIVMSYGVWAITSGEIGLSLALVVGITMGILVDDTIHFLTKYQYAREKLGYTAEDAVQFTLVKVGSAILTTSIALIAGFTILSFSTFSLNADMALFVVITIFGALICDLLLLPSLLLMLDGKRIESLVLKESDIDA